MNSAPVGDIFRGPAVLHHGRGRDRPVPHQLLPDSFRRHWLLLAGLLLLSAAAVVLVRLPIHVPGTAVRVGTGPQGHARMEILIPARYLSATRPGAAVTLRSSATGDELRARIVTVLPEALTSAEVAARPRPHAGLPAQTATVFVAVADVMSPTGAVDPATEYGARIEVARASLAELVLGSDVVPTGAAR